MWALGGRLLAALRCAHTGYRAAPRGEARNLKRMCTAWGQHTPSSQEDTAGAEDLPEFNIKTLVSLLRQENGKDLCVIRIPPEMKYVDYFVVVGGTSTRHLQALAQYTLKVYKYLKKDYNPHVCLEGKNTDDWMCIDFGNIVIHFMLQETREVYELEKLWTLRKYDDQLSQVPLETLPSDFTFGLQKTTNSDNLQE